MRRALVLSAALLALAPAAMAQEPDDEPVPEATASPEPTSPPGCERGPGTDADYAYCGDPCEVQGTDGDYTYCPSASGGGGEPPPAPRPRPAAAVQPLATQTLPMTGSETWLIGALGAGFLLTGTGLRFRFRPR